MCKKLTAERARERIEHLKTWQSTRGLTLREEEYLEALETHLLVLEGKTYAAPKYRVGQFIEYKERQVGAKNRRAQILKVEVRWLSYDEKPFISYGVKHPTMKTPLFIPEHKVIGLGEGLL